MRHRVAYLALRALGAFGLGLAIAFELLELARIAARDWPEPVGRSRA